MSVCKIIEGKHYQRRISLYKQSLNALLRIKIERNMPIDQDMKDAIVNLRLHISSDNPDKLLEIIFFKNYCKSLFPDTSGTQACMMNQYIKDVSSILALIFAVRENKNELHLAAEREPLPKCFASNHINYSRYLTFQHVNFSKVKHYNENVWNYLLKKGFRGSLSGEPFSTIPGDLITEVSINREVKVRSGPVMSGYSTSDKTDDAFIKTSHVMAKIRSKLMEQVNLLSSWVHKELSPG